MYKYKETKTAVKDWHKIKSMPKSIKDKFKYFLLDILENPQNLDTVGNPEKLKHKEFPTFSRELTKKDRIVFEIRAGADFDMPEEEIVIFLQYLGHYEDK